MLKCKLIELKSLRLVFLIEKKIIIPYRLINVWRSFIASVDATVQLNLTAFTMKNWKRFIAFINDIYGIINIKIAHSLEYRETYHVDGGSLLIITSDVFFFLNNSLMNGIEINTGIFNVCLNF